MVKKITIEPITRIEGHGKITLQLNDEGQVATADFQVTQFRGFETFCQGRPFYEMPSLVERICGICPVSHSLASAAACDAILGVRVPETALLLRRLLNCAEFVQSHALSFFYLSGPDLMLGLSSDPAQRNILGLLKSHPGIARDGIRLRQIGQEIIATLAGKRIHPNWVTPGGVKSALTPERRDFIRTLLPEALDITHRTLGRFKRMIESYRVEIRTFANFPSLFIALVNAEGKLEHVSGHLRVLTAGGDVIKGYRNYKFTVLGQIVMSHQCRTGDLCNRCSSSDFSLPQIFTPFSYIASNSRVTARTPFQKKLPARFNTVSTVSNRYPFHDFSSPAQ